MRHFNDVGSDQANIKQEDGPSLLFYYIFDDWVSSYGLIAKREHKYGVALEKLVSCMFAFLQPPVAEKDETDLFRREDKCSTAPWSTW